MIKSSQKSCDFQQCHIKYSTMIKSSQKSCDFQQCHIKYSTEFSYIFNYNLRIFHTFSTIIYKYSSHFQLSQAKLYKSSKICETTIPHPHITLHTPHPTSHSHHTHVITSRHHITSSHQLIFTHTINTTKHSSSTLPKSETTYPPISLQRDEYVYPPTTNKFFPSICLGMIGQRSSLRDVHIFVLKQLTLQ